MKYFPVLPEADVLAHVPHLAQRLLQHLVLALVVLDVLVCGMEQVDNVVVVDIVDILDNVDNPAPMG